MLGPKSCDWEFLTVLNTKLSKWSNFVLFIYLSLSVKFNVTSLNFALYINAVRTKSRGSNGPVMGVVKWGSVWSSQTINKYVSRGKLFFKVYLDTKNHCVRKQKLKVRGF